MPAPGGGSPAGDSSATGWRKRSRESSRSERRHRRSSSGERSQSSKERRGGRSPSPARSSHLASVSASSSPASSVADIQEGAMPPPPAGRFGAGGGRSGRDCSAAGRDRSPLLGPSGLGSGLRSSPVAGPSRSGNGGRSSPSPSGAGDDDRSSTVDPLDLDRDDSFWAVLRLIQEFQSLEEPASVAPTGARLILHRFSGYNQSLPRLLTCLLPPHCGLSLRT